MATPDTDRVPRPPHRPRRGRGAAVALAATLVAVGVGCADDVAGTSDATPTCTVVDLVVEPDTVEVHRELADGFNSSGDRDLDDGGCARVRVRPMTPDRVADRLLDGWSEGDDGPAPALWSPGWSVWVDRVDAARARDDQAPVTGERVEVMASPLVLALPLAVAEAMGHPQRPIGWSDLVRLAEDPQGWTAYGHPEWGQLRLGKTDPRVASDGLAALVGQAHAAHAGGGQVAPGVLTDPTVEDHITMLERSVIHYGESAARFLGRWQRADGVDAVANLAIPVVEEHRVVRHEATGASDAGEEGRSGVELVAVAPAEGTAVLDHPVVEITTGWVTDRQVAAREAYLAHLSTDRARSVARDAGFRRPDLTFAPGSPAEADPGVDTERPVAVVATPEATVIDSLLGVWPEVRRGSRVLVLIDTSASMGQPSAPGGPTRLTVLRDALGPALDRLADTADVGVWAFATDLGDDPTTTHVELVEISPLEEARDEIDAEVAALTPGRGTPLYRTVTQAVAAMADGYDPNRITSVVVVSDGVNADGDASDDPDQLDDLVALLTEQSAGASADPIRVFTVGFGATADMTPLRRLARASNGAAFDARDPDDLATVLLAVARTV